MRIGVNALIVIGVLIVIVVVVRVLRDLWWR